VDSESEPSSRGNFLMLKLPVQDDDDGDHGTVHGRHAIFIYLF
jgi:hypothetical protein